MRTRKIVYSLLLGLSLAFVSGFAFASANPQSSDLILFNGRSEEPYARSFTDNDLPWLKSSEKMVASADSFELLRTALLPFRKIEENSFGEIPVLTVRNFVSEGKKHLGGIVLWPTVVVFGDYVDISQEQSIAILNVSLYSAPDSNMLLNTQDGSITPTSIQWIKEDGLRGEYAIDLSKEFLIPRGTTLVLAEVVTKDQSMCIPQDSAFLVQFDGYAPTFIIRDSIMSPIGSLGKYPLLADQGCKSSAWIFALAPTSDGVISDLYIKYGVFHDSPKDGSWEAVWTGSK